MKELFHFSLFERKGIISLLCMALVLFVIPRWWSRYGTSDEPVRVNVLTVTLPPPEQDKPTTPALATEKKKAADNATRTQQNHPLFISINQADEKEWAQLWGIGEVLSRRIVLFRDKMGGFTHIDQVGQTYGLADSVFQRIRPKLRLETPHKRWPVNQLSAEELAQHPYISVRQAKALITYREKSGPFSSPVAFQEMRIFSREEHQRLAPYLDFSTKQKPSRQASTEAKR